MSPGRHASGAAPDPPPAARGPVARGAVMTRDAWPLPGATLTVLGADGVQSGRGTSASDGTFELVGLQPGPATLLVAAAGHEPHARSLLVPPVDRWEVGTVVLTRAGSLDLPPAGRWVIDPLHTTVQATAHHLGLSSVTGRLTRFEGEVVVGEDFADSAVDVRLDAASIDTGVAARDEHLRSADFLDVLHHPGITYRGRGLRPAGPGTWSLDGELTMLGTPRPVCLELQCTGTGEDPWGGVRSAFHASAQLRRDDFAMNWNQAFGLGVAVFGTTLRVTIDLEAVQQDG